jgi:cobalt/nickel transport system permease protein
VVVAFGPFSWQSTAGWMKCYTILAKFIVTMLALIGLISTTRFSELLAGLRKMKVPSVLVIQLGFLYRYIFVLIDIAHRILRARSGRKLRKLPFTAEVKTAGAMLGSLLIRSLDSAERINVAMRARGFDGRWRSISKLRIGAHDFAFIGICAAFMILVHFVVREVVS